MATFRKRGDKWQVQVRRKGQPTISKTFNLKTDAQGWARELELAADRGELSETIKGNDIDYTVGELLKRYRDEIVTMKRGRTVETYIVNAMLRQDFCDIKLTNISSAPFSKYRDKRLKLVRGVTVRRELSILSHAFEIARNEWSWPILTNPVRPIRKPASGKARERRLNANEEVRILQECRSCQNPWIEPCVRLAIETAMRRSEILKMNWNDVNREKCTLHISETKNGHPRNIPLTETAMSILAGLPHNLDGRVIPISATCLRMAWDRALLRAGITDLRFHDLRHEAVTRFFEKGLSVPEVALISGHRDYRMLARYTHLRPEDVRQKLLHLN